MFITIYTFTRNVWEFLLLCIPINMWCCIFLFNCAHSDTYNDILLGSICVLLITKYVEHIFVRFPINFQVHLLIFILNLFIFSLLIWTYFGIFMSQVGYLSSKSLMLVCNLPFTFFKIVFWWKAFLNFNKVYFISLFFPSK